MVNNSIQTMRWADGKFEMIDQRILPNRFEYISYDSAQSVAEGIKTMVVRGAPAIGCAAAFGIALEGLKLNKENNKDYLKNFEISFKVLDYSDSLEIDSNISNIENINKEDLSNKKRVMDEIRKPNKRQRTFRQKSGSSLERVDSGGKVKSVRPNDFTRLQDSDLPLPNNNKASIDNDDYELDFREVKIPYDVIIGRNSIIRYNLLRYDEDFARVIR